MSRVRTAVLGLVAALGCGQIGSASAAALLTFREQAGDVAGTLSGSLDLTGLVGQAGFAITGALFLPADAVLVSGETPGVAATGYLASGPASLGAETLAIPVRSGLAFALATSSLFLDSTYESESPIAGSLVFAGTTFVALGVLPGDYVWTLDNGETFTVAFVPEPGALPVLAGALGLLGLVGGHRRRRR